MMKLVRIIIFFLKYKYIGVDAPVQIERNENINNSNNLNINNIEELKIEDIFPGMLLSVRSSFQNQSFPLINIGRRTGKVSEIDLNLMRCRLDFFDIDKCSIYSFWFPFEYLQKPSVMWQVFKFFKSSFS